MAAAATLKLFHPVIAALIASFNHVSCLVRDTILGASELSARVATAEHFILVATAALVEFSNFSLAMAVLSGLNASPVHRLKATWELLGKRRKTMAHLQQMKVMLSHNANYKMYRKALAESAPPCVPYLGMFLSDLTFAYDGTPSLVHAPPLIHVQKFRVVYKVLLTIARYQKPAGYNFVVPVRGLQTHLRTLMEACLSDDEAYALSLKIEPRVKRQPPSLAVLQDENDELKDRVGVLENALALSRAEYASLQTQVDSLTEIVRRLTEASASMEVPDSATLLDSLTEEVMDESEALSYEQVLAGGGASSRRKHAIDDELDEAEQAAVDAAAVESAACDADHLAPESDSESGTHELADAAAPPSSSSLDAGDDATNDATNSAAHDADDHTSVDGLPKASKARKRQTMWTERGDADSGEEVYTTISTNVPLPVSFPLPSAHSFSNPVRVGVLRKKGALSRWQSRFVVVDQNHLFYYKKDSDAEPVGIVWLRGYVAHPSSIGKKPAVKLDHPTLRIYEFLTTSAADQVEWVSAINSAAS